MARTEPSTITTRILYVPTWVDETGSADGNMTFDLLLALSVLVAVVGTLMMDVLSADAVMVRVPSPRR